MLKVEKMYELQISDFPWLNYLVENLPAVGDTIAASLRIDGQWRIQKTNERLVASSRQECAFLVDSAKGSPIVKGPGTAKLVKDIVKDRKVAKILNETFNEIPEVLALSERYVVLDVETTGLSNYTDRVIQIAILDVTDFINKGRNSYTTEAFNATFNPWVKIPLEASRIHGIYDNDIADSPTFESCVDKIQELLKGAIIIGHNISFDLGFINAELIRSGSEPLKNKGYCTLSYSRNMMPRIGYFGAHRLGELIKVLSPKTTHKQHDAMSDALATIQLYASLQEIEKATLQEIG